MSGTLSIREVTARTGVNSATLRMWEQRYGFPTPSRTPSGHRRYAEADVVAIERVLEKRDGGLSLTAAISEGAKPPPEIGPGERDSIFAGLRRRRPGLTPYVLPKQALISVSHAIEDECATAAQRPLLFASFQRERYYRTAEARWRDLAVSARHAFVLADFERVEVQPGRPTEVPIRRSDPAGREWSVICDSSSLSIVLSACEQPGQDSTPDQDRTFEVLWSVEPDLVRTASMVALEIVARAAPSAAAEVEPELRGALPGTPEIETITALTNRMVAYTGGARRDRGPRQDAAA